MVAPLDIGLEQHDASLDLGQDDIFDLSTTMRKKKVAQLLASSDGEIGDSSEAEASDGEDEPDVECLDSGDEKETKIMNLEADLDEMYVAYQDRLRERDAKFKARSLRQQKEGREEWHGIREKDSDDEDTTDEEQSEDGGWSAMEEAKVALDDDSDDSEEDGPVVQKGKKRAMPSDTSSAAPKRPRLLVDRDELKPSGSHATKLWFSRDVFAGEGGLEVESDEDENQEGRDFAESYIDERTNVSLLFSCRYDVLTVCSSSRIQVITISK